MKGECVFLCMYKMSVFSDTCTKRVYTGTCKKRMYTGTCTEADPGGAQTSFNTVT